MEVLTMNYLTKTDPNVMQATTVEKILEVTNLSWNVIQENLFLEDGTEIPNTKVNLRSTDKAVLGIVTNRYEIVQNNEAFDFVNELLKNDIVPETAGDLNNGKFIYLKTDLKNIYVDCLKENIDCKLVFTNSHDGKSSVKVNIVPVIEGNPLNLNLFHKRNWNAVHSKSVNAKMKIAKDTLSMAHSYIQELIQETNKLNKITFTEQQKTMFVKMLFPMKNNLSTKQYENIEEQQNSLMSHICGNTAFNFIMGVSSYISNLEPKRKTNSFYAKKFLNIVNGYQLLDKAYSIINNSIKNN